MNHLSNTESPQMKGTVLVSYKGELCVQVIDDLLLSIDQKFGNTELKIRKRVFSIATECLQNVHHHAHHATCIGAPEGYSLNKYLSFEIFKDENGYSIHVGNYICNSVKQDIINRITGVNNANLSELRQMYINQLISKRRAGSVTAGLGFIEMAKRSKNRLEYEFEPVDQFASILRVKIKVN